jgi:uncharacterized LabA/DUF88 family protein
MKIRIFIDFWNFQLNVRDRTPREFLIGWEKINQVMTDRAAQLIGQSLTFEETRVYLSYNPRNPDDRKLRNWATNVLDRLPGIQVSLSERKPKNPPVCSACHKEISICPHCSMPMKGTIEKGVDTAIVTDLLSLAWAGAWDVAILVSSDRDYIPAIKSWAIKGYRVINAYFPPQGMDLARECWGNFDLVPCLTALRRNTTNFNVG